MDELYEQIDQLVNLLDLLKSRYFSLRAKSDIGIVSIFSIVK